MLLEIGLLKRKKQKQKQNESQKKNSKLHKVWAIPVPSSTSVALMAIFIIFLII